MNSEEHAHGEPRKKQSNTLPLWGNAATMNVNSMVHTNILASPYFKNQLIKLKTYHEVVDEIYYKVDHLEPWEKGSRKTAGQVGMCGGVRGVGAGGIVSTAFCLLFKLFTLKLTRKQLKGLMDHPDSPFIRGLGFMYIRYCQPPSDYWRWYEEYLEDEEELDVKSGGGCVMTVGQMVRSFILKLDWYGTLFPRIPVPIQKELQGKLSQANLCDDHKRKAEEGWGEAERYSKGMRDEQDDETNEDSSWGEAAKYSKRAHEEAATRTSKDHESSSRNHRDSPAKRRRSRSRDRSGRRCDSAEKRSSRRSSSRERHAKRRSRERQSRRRSDSGERRVRQRSRSGSRRTDDDRRDRRRSPNHNRRRKRSSSHEGSRTRRGDSATKSKSSKGRSDSPGRKHRHRRRSTSRSDEESPRCLRDIVPNAIDATTDNGHGIEVNLLVDEFGRDRAQRPAPKACESADMQVSRKEKDLAAEPSSGSSSRQINDPTMPESKDDRQPRRRSILLSSYSSDSDTSMPDKSVRKDSGLENSSAEDGELIDKKKKKKKEKKSKKHKHKKDRKKRDRSDDDAD